MSEKFTPTPIVIRTSLDEHGSLLDIPRIAGEDLVSYSKRLFDAYANRASSTYEGLVNGINRELGLSRKDILEIKIRGLGFGYFTDIDISYTSTTITNNKSYTNTIDGITIIAVGDTLTDPSMNWEVNHLRGFKLTVNTEEYRIISNDATSIKIDGNMSGLVGQVYLIDTSWEDNSLVGLGLEIGNKLYKIAENTSNVLQIESGDLTSCVCNLVESEYKIRAFNPKVEVTGSKFNLYKEYSNPENFQLEVKIDLREDVRFHKDIIDTINSLSFFEAENLLDYREDIFAFELKKQSSEHVVIKEIIPAAKFFKLENTKIKEDSVKFTEANIFLRETDEESVSQLIGNYNIDYNKGIIKVNTIPSGKKTASYIWNELPFIVTTSPVIINALNREDSEEFLFLQEEMKRYTSVEDRFRSSIPKADMIEYMAELLAVKPENWGE